MTGYQRPYVIRNPTKTDDPRRLQETVEAALRASGLPSAAWLDTTAADPGRGQTQQALSQGADLILACGGDGTVRACVGVLAGQHVPLGLLPLGTGNLLARNLDIPLTLEHSVQLVAAGQLRTIDVAELDGDVFAVMGGAGFDAQLFDFTSERLKSRIGWAAYVVAGLRALRAARTDDVELTLDGVTTRARGVGVLVGNVGTLTGGLTLLPTARPDDGVLDVAILTPTTKADWAGLTARVVAGRRPQPWQLQHFTAREIRVVFSSPVPVELDGDLLSPRSDFTVRVMPSSLTVCAPPATGPR